MAKLSEREPFAFTPTGFIGRSKASERLYATEEKLQSVLSAIADELIQYFDRSQKEYWSFGMTNAVYQALEGVEARCAVSAAKHYLEQNGYVVTKK